MTEHRCKKCAALLASDEISLFRRLVSRTADSYLCLDCLAEKLSTTREQLEGLIDYFYKTGICSLFVKE